MGPKTHKKIWSSLQALVEVDTLITFLPNPFLESGSSAALLLVVSSSPVDQSLIEMNDHIMKGGHVIIKAGANPLWIFQLD